MWNLIRAQSYQIKRSLSVYILVFISAFIHIMGQLANESGMDELTGSLFVINNLGFIEVQFVIISVVIIPLIFAGDMKDKTLNYEVLSGHSRSRMFFSRVIYGYFVALLFCIVCTLGPIILVTILKGWGNNLVFKDVMLQYFLLLIVYIRWIGELILLSVIIRNAAGTGVIAFTCYQVGMIVSLIINEIKEVPLKHIFSSANISNIVQFSNCKDVVIDGEIVSLYEINLTGQFIQNTIVISLLVAFVCVLLGLKLFRKRDLT